MDEQRYKELSLSRILCFVLAGALAVIGGFRFFLNADFVGLAEDAVLGLAAALAGQLYYSSARRAMEKEKVEDLDREDEGL